MNAKLGSALGLATALVAALAMAFAASGCSGSGSGSSGAAGTSVAATTSATQGPDLTPPEVTVSQPTRGAFLPSGPVQVSGTARDAQSGLASLTIQGNAVNVDASGAFSTTVTLDPGVAPITLVATDKAGNRTVRTVSVETGDYVAAGTLVPGALAGRINASGLTLMERLGPAEIAALTTQIAASLQTSPLYTGYTVQIVVQSVSLGTPALKIDSSTAGLSVYLVVPQVSIAIAATDTLGFPITTGTITADAATITALVQLGTNPGGGLAVTFPQLTVDLQNFDLQLSGLLSFLGPIAGPVALPLIKSQVQSLIQTQGPTAIASLVDRAATFALGGTTGTFSYALDGIATDAQGIAFSTGIDLALAPDPSYPVPPGSLLTQGALPTTTSTLPTAVFSVSETAINRVLAQAWQSGALAYDAVPASLTQTFGGTSLPIGSTAADLAAFLPELQGAIPPQDLARPLVYRIRSLLPPTARVVAGVADPLRLRFGEYEVTASVDEGGGKLLDLFTVSMAAEVQLGLAVQHGVLVPDMKSLPNPKIAADLVSSPLAPIGAAYLESYLDGTLSMLLGGIVQRLPPIPAPALPAGAVLDGATLHADGANGTYLTVELEVK